MAVKNEERRTVILASAYRLFSQYDYEDVSLAMIAKESGISKSLLQKYYAQKKNIVEAMLYDVLNISFQYMDTLPFKYTDIFQKISDFDRLFFWMSEKDKNFGQFILASVAQPDLLDAWIEILCQWLKKLCGADTFSYLQLKKAFTFGMGGAMHLYQHKDELDIDYRYITKIDIQATLEMLGMSEEYIEKLDKRTQQHAKKMDPLLLLKYCEKNISWFSASC